MPIYTPKRPTAFPSQGRAVGRFAPSPTGELHLGSLTTAIASYCHIKSIEGEWLLRIEDTDRQRCHPDFSKQIMIDLENLGLHWDGSVWYQSQRDDVYNDILYNALSQRIYGCQCSRKQLRGHDIYPRFCLPKTPSPALTPESTKTALEGLKTRIQLPNYTIGFLDHLQGMQWANPQQTLGDVVLRRADHIINYFLAVSVDDGLQGVTHIMRGLDILPLTTAQIAIMDYIDLPAVEHWYHLPLVENEQGQKLSKQNLATPIDTSSVEKCQQLIQVALKLLKQQPVDVDAPSVMLQQATQQWDNAPLKNHHSLGQV